MMSQTSYNIGIVGATGAVGTEILALLEKKKFPTKTLSCFASEKSLDKFLSFQGEKTPIRKLTASSFKGLDIVFFCAGSLVSKQFAHQAVQHNAIVIDNSSYFRKDPNVPLVIPEINSHTLKKHQGIIANPNCSTIIMLMVVAPLHRHKKIKRIVAATYQAASGAGAQGMHELKESTWAYIKGEPFQQTIFPFPYAFNLFAHNSSLQESGYVEEELKMLFETQKILEDSTLRITATCIRVPILRAHSEALNIEFSGPISVQEAYEILHKAPGVKILEDRTQNRFPMPLDASGKEEVFCGRIRKDHSQPDTLDVWVVGDQLLKGAALNAVQIAEHLTHPLSLSVNL